MAIPQFALLRFVWRSYDTTPVRKNQFILKKAAFPFFEVRYTNRKVGRGNVGLPLQKTP